MTSLIHSMIICLFLSVSKNTIIVKTSSQSSGERSSLQATRKKTNLVSTLRVFQLQGVERYIRHQIII